VIKYAVVALALFALFQPAAAANDGVLLRDHVLKAYPSLLYVDKYRRAFPNEVQGTKPFWTDDGAGLRMGNPTQLIAALAELQDPHVSLVGKSAGKPETLGVLFRTSSDGSMVVWRVFDASAYAVHVGEQVLSIDGVPTQTWLRRAASMTFGGNRRGRYAEAALDLGLGTPIVHRTAHLGNTIHLVVRSSSGARRTVALAYRPMNARRALALATALDKPDLPATFTTSGQRIGTLRIGAFAAQYDPVFLAASDRASKRQGTTDDQAMQAGYCAVASVLMKRFDSVARDSDVIILDLRGNLGGFDREARLEADAIAPSTPARTFDLFATGKPGTVRLAEQLFDPPCRHVAIRRPIVVLVDAGTRSSGELVAAWLWTSGAIIAGERTAGAGGGLDYDAKGFPLPTSGFSVRMSGNFTIFDPALHLNEGDWSEKDIVAQVTADRFGPSRERAFAFQAVGLRPDIVAPTTLSDLVDGGLAQAERIVAKLAAQRRPRNDVTCVRLVAPTGVESSDRGPGRSRRLPRTPLL
jgi:C-terminal processing protease CtpA/Prc